MTNAMLLVNGFVVLLLPMVAISMVRGTLPPDTTWLGRLYRIDPRLPLVSNLFVLALGSTALVRLGAHFGLLDATGRRLAEDVTGTAFVMLWCAYSFLMIRAALKLRRDLKSRP